MPNLWVRFIKNPLCLSLHVTSNGKQVPACSLLGQSIRSMSGACVAEHHVATTACCACQCAYEARYHNLFASPVQMRACRPGLTRRRRQRRPVRAAGAYKLQPRPAPAPFLPQLSMRGEPSEAALESAAAPDERDDEDDMASMLEQPDGHRGRASRAGLGGAWCDPWLSMQSYCTRCRLFGDADANQSITQCDKLMFAFLSSGSGLGDAQKDACAEGLPSAPSIATGACEFLLSAEICLPACLPSITLC